MTCHVVFTLDNSIHANFLKPLSQRGMLICHVTWCAFSWQRVFSTIAVQASPQTVTLTQATAAGQQVQMIPAVTATAQVVQQKLMQQQVVTTAAQLQNPGVANPAQVPASSDSPSQQPKLQMRVPAVRLKTPTKPPCP